MPSVGGVRVCAGEERREWRSTICAIGGENGGGWWASEFSFVFVFVFVFVFLFGMIHSLLGWSI
jgi:hypothetical protein